MLNQVVLAGNTKFLAMLFSSVGIGGVAAVGILGATGNLFNTLRTILDGVDSKGGQVASKVKSEDNLTAALLAKLSQQQQPAPVRSRPPNSRG